MKVSNILIDIFKRLSYLLQLCSLILLAGFSVPIVPLLLQVGLPLDLRLVETVDYGVFSLGNEDTLDFLGVFEGYLADIHGTVLFEVGPWSVDDGDVVFLVAWDMLESG